MKKKWKWVAGIAALAVLAGLWTWRYLAVQAWYAPLMMEMKDEYYGIGEFVEIGHSSSYKMKDNGGFRFRVNSREILEYSAWMERSGGADPYAQTDLESPDKLMLVSVTLQNVDNERGRFSLHDLHMGGTGVGASSVQEPVLLADNPELEGTQLQLELGEQITVTVPYSLNREHFSDPTWSCLEEFGFRLGTQEANQGVNTRKWVLLNGKV